jgi:hypothetical protein
MKPDWNQPDTPETAINFALTIKEGVGDNICGILSYLPDNLYMNKDVVEAFGSVDIGHVANAVIIKGIGSKILANFILKFVKIPVPMKIFTNTDKAEKWLLGHIARAKQKAQNTLTQ